MAAHLGTDFRAIRIATAIGGYRAQGALASLAGVMSVFGTHSKVAASGLTRGRYAIEPPDREVRGALSVAADNVDVRRCGDGSIDVEFYKARAYAIRRAAQVRLAQALGRRARFVLKRAHKFIRGREKI